MRKRVAAAEHFDVFPIAEAERKASEPRVKPNEDAGMCRCPGCGEMFQCQSSQDMFLHHEHVLHPHRFRFGSASSR
jgi:uncharacterized C2H2 Zn-finger protein